MDNSSNCGADLDNEIKQQILGVLGRRGLLTAGCIGTMSLQACGDLAEEIGFALPGVALIDDIDRVIREFRGGSHRTSSEERPALLDRSLGVQDVPKTASVGGSSSQINANIRASQLTPASFDEIEHDAADSPQNRVWIDLTMEIDEEQGDEGSEYQESSNNDSEETSEDSDRGASRNSSEDREVSDGEYLETSDSEYAETTDDPSDTRFYTPTQPESMSPPASTAVISRGNDQQLERMPWTMLGYEKEAVVNEKYQEWIRNNIDLCLATANVNVQHYQGRNSIVDRYWAETARRVFSSLKIDFDFQNFKAHFEENGHVPTNLQVLDWIRNPSGRDRESSKRSANSRH